MESLRISHRCIEPQLMKSFVSNIVAVSAEHPDMFADKFLSHFSSLKSNSSQHIVGSLADTFLSRASPDRSSSSWEYDDILDSTDLPKCRSKHILDSTQLNFLCDLYANLACVPPSSIETPSACWKYSSVTFNGQVLACRNSRSQSSSIVFANWDRKLFGHPLSSIVEDLIVFDLQ